MKVLGLAVLIGCLFVGIAEAQAPKVNPTTIEWTAPTTNADGTPLTDLASYRIRVRANAVGPVVKTIDQASTTSTPVPGTTVSRGGASSPLFQELNLADGSYIVTVSAIDTIGNESAESPSVPFVSNRQSPAAPTGVILK